MNKKGYASRERVYLEAIQHYGTDMQTAVAIEEMAELVKELTKAKRGAANYVHMAEEIADVQIMMEQLQLMFPVRAWVERFMGSKVDRLERRIKEDKNGLHDR